MNHECAQADCEYTHSHFDNTPEQPRGSRAHLAQTTYGCGVCGVAVSPLSDYGFHDQAEDEPEWVPVCWACYREV